MLAFLFLPAHRHIFQFENKNKTPLSVFVLSNKCARFIVTISFLFNLFFVASKLLKEKRREKSWFLLFFFFGRWKSKQGKHISFWFGWQYNTWLVYLLDFFFFFIIFWCSSVDRRPIWLYIIKEMKSNQN